MMLPQNHSQRGELNDEVHARPSESLVAPARVSYLAMLSGDATLEQEWQHVVDLIRRYAVDPPSRGAKHYSADLGPFRLTWERHTEFSRFQFIVAGAGEDPFREPAIAAVPAEWLSAITGETLVAAHGALIGDDREPVDPDAISARLFAGNGLVGAVVAGGAATAFTDFRIHDDGFSRMLVRDGSLTPRQAGRTIQRLLEIDTYRIMALLALPVARDLAPFLTRYEREIVEITTALASAGVDDEPELLDRLTRLQAAIGSREADNQYRFSAAAAYYDLVGRRTAELREERIEGLQTFGEFTERRLAPAMSTCRAMASRQEALFQRTERATQLLSTRVEMTVARQNQAVLESMNRRVALQLRLQQTVEGLSVAAITYYIVGLVGYAAKGLEATGLRVDAEIVVGISIPVVAVLVALGVRRIRKRVEHAAP